jgi:hypothetical protein
MESDNGGRLAPGAETPRPDDQSGVSPISVDVFDTTFRSLVVVDFDVVVVVVTIAMLLESNKCFFAISTDTSLRAVVVEAFLPPETFAPGESTPFARNGATIGMSG